MLTESFVLLFVLYFLKWYYKRCMIKSKLKKYKLVKGWPILGIMPDFLNPSDNLKAALKYYKQYGDNFIMWLGNKYVLTITEPNLTEFILGSSKFIDKTEDYKFLENWFGQGLLTSSGRRWKTHRRLLTPSFHYTILEDFVQVFDKESQVLVHQLDKEVGKDQFEVFQYITLCTLDIICETAMGTSVQAQLYPNSEYVKSVKNMCQVLHYRVFSLFSRHDFLYQFTRTYRTEMKALKIIHGHTKNVIKLRKAALATNPNQLDINIDDFGIKKRITFLDALLQCRIDGVPLSEEDIREEVDTFMFEGHDTTAACISFTLYLLSMHQDVQQKVYKEINSLLEDNKEKSVTYEILQQMKYLEMVIKESLRLYPSVPAFTRTLKEEVEYDGMTFPKNMDVGLVCFLLHRNPNIYPEPEKFNPERFNNENSLKRHPYAYIPFSAGPRNCIGQKFAMLELKCTISKVLRYYKLLPTIPEHIVQPTAEVTICSSNGIKMRIEKRYSY